LVGNNNICKLSDFGSAKLIGLNATTMNTVGKGTPFWMAPEVMFGQAYSLSADVYSLGIVFYELFENKLPQYDHDRRTILLESYTFMCCGIVLPMLHLTPSKRPKALIIAERLDTILREVAEFQKLELGPDKNLDDLFITNDLVGCPDENIDKFISEALHKPYLSPPKVPQRNYHLEVSASPKTRKLPSDENLGCLSKSQLPEKDKTTSSPFFIKPPYPNPDNGNRSPRSPRQREGRGSFYEKSEISPLRSSTRQTNIKIGTSHVKKVVEPVSLEAPSSPEGSESEDEFSPGTALKVTEDFYSEDRGEIGVKKDEKVFFIKRNSNYLYVRTQSHHEGWIPINVVEVNDD